MRSDSFWAGGQAEYEKAIREQYAPVLDDLKARLNSAKDEAQRAETESEIARTEAECRATLKGADDAIF